MRAAIRRGIGIRETGTTIHIYQENVMAHLMCFCEKDKNEVLPTEGDVNFHHSIHAFYHSLIVIAD
jgi:hypothetical protein